MNKYKGRKYHHGRNVQNIAGIKKALHEVLIHKGPITKIAQKYKVSRSTLYRRLRQYRPKKLTRRENLYLLNRYTLALVHNGGHLFTGLKTTLEDTETILHNGDVPKRTSTMDVQTILCLKRGLQYISMLHKPLSVSVIKHINEIVGYDSLFPGHFAKQRMAINGIKYIPPLPSIKTASHILKHYKHSQMSTSMKAIHIMLQYDRHQFFWDGNKRTAWLSANYFLLCHGGGILDIDIHQAPKWNHLLSRFYETGKISKIAKWLNNNCIINKI